MKAIICLVCAFFLSISMVQSDVILHQATKAPLTQEKVEVVVKSNREDLAEQRNPSEQNSVDQKSVQNILVIGSDEMSGVYDEDARSDCMILVSLDTKK